MEPQTTTAGPARPATAAGHRRRQLYHTLWAVLLGGWLFSYADRTLTGPVVTWLIDNKVGVVGGSSHPHALGGS